MLDFYLALNDLYALLWTYIIKYGSSPEFWVQTFILITGVVGQILVAKKDIRAFYFWSVGNIFIIISTLPKEQYGMALFYFFSIGFNIYSIMKWRKDHEREQGVKAESHDVGQRVGATASNH